MSSDVFLSYARHDEKLARSIAVLLKDAGVTVWYDHELIPGQNWAAQIRTQLTEAKIVLVLFTASSRASKFVQDLAGQARFVLVLISGDDIAASIIDYRHSAGGVNSLQFRARQNVILELGFFFGALGPEKVFVFQKAPTHELPVLPRFERPSDLDGRMFMSFDAAGGWKQRLRKKLDEHNFSIKSEK